LIAVRVARASARRLDERKQGSHRGRRLQAPQQHHLLDAQEAAVTSASSHPIAVDVRASAVEQRLSTLATNPEEAPPEGQGAAWARE
jgi:hypothetical protein